jgi:hypothetical protein
VKKYVQPAPVAGIAAQATSSQRSGAFPIQRLLWRGCTGSTAALEKNGQWLFMADSDYSDSFPITVSAKISVIDQCQLCRTNPQRQ